MTYQAFIQDCFQEDNPFAVKKKYLQDFACYVPDTADAASIKRLTKEDFIRFFREQRGGFSCAAFRKNRRLLENLFLALQKNPKRSRSGPLYTATLLVLTITFINFILKTWKNWMPFYIPFALILIRWERSICWISGHCFTCFGMGLIQKI